MSKKTYAEALRLAKSGQLKDAESLCRALLKDAPDDYQTLYLNSSMCLLLHQYEESRLLCEKLLTLDDKNADVYNLLAAISESHDKDRAATEHWLRKALECDPFNDKVKTSLGNLLVKKQGLEEAASCFKQVLAANPANADAIGGLAMIAARRGDLESAIEGYKEALKFAPESGEILNNLISALFKLDRREEAVEYSLVVSSLENPGIAAVTAATITSFYCLFDAQEKLLPHALKVFASLPEEAGLYSFASLSLLSASLLSNEQLLAFHRQAAMVIRHSIRHEPFADYPKAFSQLEKIRVGYLSSDFYNHVLGNFFRWLVNHSDTSRFEIYMYSNRATEKEDSTTEEYRRAVGNFFNVAELSDEELAGRIHADGIHVLVEMNGHTGSGTAARLGVLAYRPAPVQIAYLNYPYSYGMQEVDYVISDPWLNGEENAAYFDEKPLEMPGSFLTIGKYYVRDISPQSARARNGYLTFGSLNNIYKLNKKTIGLWSEILRRVPDSKLYLNHPGLAAKRARDAILAEFSKRNISPERITLAWEKHVTGSHLSFYNEIDIALDALPLTGGTTTVDALWMGVPVITLVGQAHAQRLSYSIINNSGIGMDDCIAFDEAEYVEKAVSLASNPSRLDFLGKTIPVAMSNSTLCDTAKFTQDMESLYIKAWNDKFPTKSIGDLMISSKSIALPVAAADCSIVVADDSNDLYAYVLREQQGWFEAEFAFLVHVGKAFKSFWDFSEDPGVYAVPIASQQVQSGGKTLAIRSSDNFSGLLAESAIFNRLDNLTVTASPESEELPDLVRFSLDCNDGEGNVLSSWLDKVDSSSPLVLVSLRNAQGGDLSALPVLAERGYQSYRLLPGYDLLVPHKFGDRLYASDINLFFCKQDRAQSLNAAGLLCIEQQEIENMPTPDAELWPDLIKGLPYASAKLPIWMDRESLGKWGEMYLTALNLYSGARDVELSPAQRYARIRLVQTIMPLLMQSEATPSRLLSGIRMMADCGNRELAVQWANVLVQGMEGITGECLDEPFFPPEAIWESIPLTQDETDWVLPVALASMERLSRFSSWFTGNQGLQVWNKCLNYPCVAHEAKRMVDLILSREPQ